MAEPVEADGPQCRARAHGCEDGASGTRVLQEGLRWDTGEPVLIPGRLSLQAYPTISAWLFDIFLCTSRISSLKLWGLRRQGAVDCLDLAPPSPHTVFTF